MTKNQHRTNQPPVVLLVLMSIHSSGPLFLFLSASSGWLLVDFVRGDSSGSGPVRSSKNKSFVDDGRRCKWWIVGVSDSKFWFNRLAHKQRLFLSASCGWLLGYFIRGNSSGSGSVHFKQWTHPTSAQLVCSGYLNLVIRLQYKQFLLLSASCGWLLLCFWVWWFW